MERQMCVLFGLDGVMLDAEPRYAMIWKFLADKYDAEGAGVLEVTTAEDPDRIIARYFSHLTDNEKQSLKNELAEREEKAKNPHISGLDDFIDKLRDKGVKMGLVTNYSDEELSRLYNESDFVKIKDKMDVIVSGNRTLDDEDKPNLEAGYKLAAENLEYKPEDCLVFDASYEGIEAAKRLGMRVVGIALYHPEDSLRERADKVITDFSQFSIDKDSDFWN